MAKKTGYLKTCKPRSKVPDTMLRCGFCGKLNTDLKMTIVESEKTSSGGLFRRAHCKGCATAYKRTRNIINNKIAEGESQTPKVIIDMDYTVNTFQETWQKLIETATSGNPTKEEKNHDER